MPIPSYDDEFLNGEPMRPTEITRTEPELRPLAEQLSACIQEHPATYGITKADADALVSELMPLIRRKAHELPPLPEGYSVVVSNGKALLYFENMHITVVEHELRALALEHAIARFRREQGKGRG
jgi:hypothetical protein